MQRLDLTATMYQIATVWGIFVSRTQDTEPAALLEMFSSEEGPYAMMVGLRWTQMSSVEKLDLLGQSDIQVVQGKLYMWLSKHLYIHYYYQVMPFFNLYVFFISDMEPSQTDS